MPAILRDDKPHTADLGITTLTDIVKGNSIWRGRSRDAIIQAGSGDKSMPLFVVETISQFKHKYLVEADTADAAQAFWQSHNEDDDFREGCQQFLGEMDIGLREVTDASEEVDDYLKEIADQFINR